MRIDMTLDEASVDNAIKQLQKYKTSLSSKLDDFLDALADIGVNTIDNIVSFIPQDQELDSGTITKVPSRLQDGRSRMKIRFTSEDVLFIEFSAGITYGTNSYPLPSGSGYGMGTYNPSSDRWSNPKGWYYKDESSPYANENGIVHSYGNPAYMPMYHAIEDMTLQIWATAYKIFWTGV